MLLFRLLRDLLGHGNAENIADTSSLYEKKSLPMPRFMRKPGSPSVLCLTHSYKGNGAAEMMVFVLKWMIFEKGWQVQALSEGLSDGDMLVLKGLGVGLVDSVEAEQYDFAIANTVVSGLLHIHRYGQLLPCVLWVHEGETFLWTSQTPLALLKQIFSTARHVVFQSRWQAERIFGSFTSALTKARYSVVPNCLPELPARIDQPKMRIPGKKRIVFVGGVYGRKRPFDLVDAVNRIGRNDVECVFIGTTEHLKTLPICVHEAVKNKERFVFTGEISRSETAAYIASADVLSLPSGDESQPLVLLEASHYKVPIVISDLSVYDDIWFNGRNCLKHAVGDVEQLSAHLLTALEGNAPPSSLPGETEVSPEAFFSKFSAIFDDLLSKK